MNRKYIFSALMIFGLCLFPNFAVGVAVSPYRQTAVVSPGEAEEIFIDIINDSDEEAEFDFTIEAFTIDEETGLAEYGETDIATTWIKIRPELAHIESGASKSILLEVDVPESAEPFSHYLSFFAKNNGQGQIAISPRIGSLIFLHVAGEVSESMVRRIFDAGKSSFFGSIDIVLEFENEGTIHLVPTGVVQLLSGAGEVLQEQNLNDNDTKVLPYGRWKREYSFEEISKFRVGPHTIRYSVEYGQTGKRISEYATVWIFPSWLAGAGLVLIIGFIGMVIFKLVHRRHENSSKK